MPHRPCLGWGEQHCATLTTHTRCPTHQAMREAARNRPTARQRGYDTTHDHARAHALPNAYGKPCPRCGQPMLTDQALDYGHSVDRATDPTARADRIEHADCNRAAGGRLSHQRQGHQPPDR